MEHPKIGGKRRLVVAQLNHLATPSQTGRASPTTEIRIFKAEPTGCTTVSLMLLLGDCNKGVIRIYARKGGCVLVLQGAIF